MTEILAVLLAVNILLCVVVLALCFKLNKDWSNFAVKINAEWSALYMLMIGAYDEMDGDIENERD